LEHNEHHCFSIQGYPPILDQSKRRPWFVNRSEVEEWISQLRQTNSDDFGR
jgi:hypothetical protein